MYGARETESRQTRARALGALGVRDVTSVPGRLPPPASLITATPSPSYYPLAQPPQPAQDPGALPSCQPFSRTPVMGLVGWSPLCALQASRCWLVGPALCAQAVTCTCTHVVSVTVHATLRAPRPVACPPHNHASASHSARTASRAALATSLATCMIGSRAAAAAPMVRVAVDDNFAWGLPLGVCVGAANDV